MEIFMNLDKLWNRSSLKDTHRLVARTAVPNDVPDTDEACQALARTRIESMSAAISAKPGFLTLFHITLADHAESIMTKPAGKFHMTDIFQAAYWWHRLRRERDWTEDSMRTLRYDVPIDVYEQNIRSQDYDPYWVGPRGEYVTYAPDSLPEPTVLKKADISRIFDAYRATPDAAALDRVFLWYEPERLLPEIK
jgi:hypothetical protein